MGGAAFASATLDAAAATENKGSVQTPDPFLKRILSVANQRALEFCREQGVTIGFKDLGAGGVACVTSELCDAGGFGCDVDLALEHMDRGEYGLCRECGEAIAEARLEIQPTARLCIDCAAARE